MQRTPLKKNRQNRFFTNDRKERTIGGKFPLLRGKIPQLGRRGKFTLLRGKIPHCFSLLRLSIDACRKRKSAPGSSSKRNHLKSLRFLLSSFSISAQCLPFSAASHSGKDNMAKNNQEPCLTCVQFCGAHRTVCPGPPVVTDKSTKHDKTDTARKRMPLNRPMPDPSDELKFSCRKMNFIV